MEWELVHVKDMEATMDDSGVYVTIHRVADRTAGINTVRADLWQTVRISDGADIPLVSFDGTANAVRKHLIHFIHDYCNGVDKYLSQEHASYIGYELHRAEATENYVQE